MPHGHISFKQMKHEIELIGGWLYRYDETNVTFSIDNDDYNRAVMRRIIRDDKILSVTNIP